MGIISVDKIEVGMVLAEKVLTVKRMMLLPEGIVLTSGHLTTFRTWGISEVNIVGDESSEGAENEASPEELQELRREITDIFINNNLEDSFTQKIYQLACEFSGKDI